MIPAERNRQVVPLEQISPWLTRATVAIEDRRFFAHGGIDAEGIARALWRDVKAGTVVEGGSTITQQLVRNLYISNERTVAAEADGGVSGGEARPRLVRRTRCSRAT